MATKDVTMRLTRSDGVVFDIDNTRWFMQRDSLADFATTVEGVVKMDDYAAADGGFVSMRRFGTTDRTAVIYSSLDPLVMREEALSFFTPGADYTAEVVFMGKKRSCEGALGGFKMALGSPYTDTAVTFTLMCPDPFFLGERKTVLLPSSTETADYGMEMPWKVSEVAVNVPQSRTYAGFVSGAQRLIAGADGWEFNCQTDIRTPVKVTFDCVVKEEKEGAVRMKLMREAGSSEAQRIGLPTSVVALKGDSAATIGSTTPVIPALAVGTEFTAVFDWEGRSFTCNGSDNVNIDIAHISPDDVRSGIFDGYAVPGRVAVSFEGYSGATTVAEAVRATVEYTERHYGL